MAVCHRVMAAQVDRRRDVGQSIAAVTKELPEINACHDEEAESVPSWARRRGSYCTWDGSGCLSLSLGNKKARYAMLRLVEKLERGLHTVYLQLDEREQVNAQDDSEPQLLDWVKNESLVLIAKVG